MPKTLQCTQVPKERLEKLIEADALRSAHEARGVPRRSPSLPPNRVDEEKFYLGLLQDLQPVVEWAVAHPTPLDWGTAASLEGQYRVALPRALEALATFERRLKLGDGRWKADTSPQQVYRNVCALLEQALLGLVPEPPGAAPSWFELGLEAFAEVTGFLATDARLANVIRGETSTQTVGTWAYLWPEQVLALVAAPPPLPPGLPEAARRVWSHLEQCARQGKAHVGCVLAYSDE